MRASLVAPELCQAMLKDRIDMLLCVGLVKRDRPQLRTSFVRNGTVDSDTRNARAMKMVLLGTRVLIHGELRVISKYRKGYVTAIPLMEPFQ